jgi:hypothetical protein
MSTTYGLKCADCNKESNTDFHPETIEELVKNRNAILTVHDLANQCWQGFEFRILQDFDEPFLIDFLREHQEHKLLLLSEYGDESKVLKYAGQMDT